MQCNDLQFPVRLKATRVEEKKRDSYVEFDRIEAQVSDMAVPLPSMHSSDKVL